MGKVADRYNKEWYDKRQRQNAEIEKFLINIIWKNKEQHFPWTKADLKNLPYADLMEIAVAACNKQISVDLGPGKDWSNDADGKVSIVRLNSYGKCYSSGVTGCKNKHHILALVFEPHLEKFYFFSFPAMMTEHTIPFDLYTCKPKRVSKLGPVAMWEHECATFEEMANSVVPVKKLLKVALSPKARRSKALPQYDSLFM